MICGIRRFFLLVFGFCCFLLLFFAQHFFILFFPGRRSSTMNRAMLFAWIAPDYIGELRSTFSANILSIFMVVQHIFVSREQRTQQTPNARVSYALLVCAFIHRFPSSSVDVCCMCSFAFVGGGEAVNEPTNGLSHDQTHDFSTIPCICDRFFPRVHACNCHPDECFVCCMKSNAA